MKKGLLAFITSPILWGGGACFGFYTLIRRGMIHDELVVRYTSGHPVEYITVALFFIGMTSLFFKYLRIAADRRRLRLGLIFPPIKPQRESSGEVNGYLETLTKAVSVRGESLHISRLRRALRFLQSGGRVDDLDQELRSLADDDAFAAEADYGMVKMFIWAIPILGFLGTVIGITAALGNLNLTELETTGKLLASGLKVAFDTTALALSLVFVLYFTQYFVQRSESKFFARVDRLVDRELHGRFRPASSPLEEEELKASRRILKMMVESFDKLMRRQTEIWEEAMAAAAKQSGDIIQSGAERIQLSLNDALGEALRKHADMINRGEEEFFSEIIAPVLRSMREHLNGVESLRSQMVEETKVVRELLHANGEITRLEDRLNQNLRSLAEAGSFVDTANALADAVRLLNGKLKEPTVGKNTSRLSALIEKSKERFGEPETIPLHDGGAAEAENNEGGTEMPTYSVHTPKLRAGFWGKKKSA
ncbi:MAG: MotA/TolQ/ExbB proton channel family protein [Thermoguttaceae bacterium]|nr:MotA/TolQ/ExbB proton channel family protein [Thermoguttaceae bacterium]